MNTNIVFEVYKTICGTSIVTISSLVDEEDKEIFLESSKELYNTMFSLSEKYNGCIDVYFVIR